jgi:hypothetical protein
MMRHSMEHRAPAACALAALVLLGASPQHAQEPFQDYQRPVSGPLMISDFDRMGWQTNLSDPFGTWNQDPDDDTQSCKARLVDDPRVGDQGYSLMLDYDVLSPNPAFNGFWMKLPAVRTRDFGALTLAVKGDPDRGFTTRLKLELKDKRGSATYILDGITAEWRRIRIPLSAFDGIRKIKAATEFVIVFDDETVTEPIGTIFLDEVGFEPAL